MDNKEPVLTEPQSIKPIQSAGKKLSEARLSWELSVEEVAENLNLSAETVKALERDDYDRLPGYTFVKGYIRSYSTLLRLDPEDVLSGIDLQPERLSEIPASRSAVKFKSRSRPNKKKSRGGKFVRAILFLVLLVVLALFGLNQFSKIDKDELARIFKIPTSEETQSAGENEIVFPATESDGKKKEALIRIE